MQVSPLLTPAAAPRLSSMSRPPARAGGDEVHLSGPSEPQELPAESPARVQGAEVAKHSGWARGVCLVLAASIGAVALSGCTQQPTPPPVSQGTSHSQAEQALSQAFDDADAMLAQAKDDDGAKEQAARNVMGAIGKYARDTGRSAQQVASDIKGFMVEHPVLTLSVAYSAGVAAGIGLEHLGLTDAAGTSVEAIKQAVKDHPIITGVVVVAATAAVGYMIYQALETEATPVSPPPATPEAQKLQAEFDALEKQIADSQGTNTKAEAAQVNQTLKGKIAEYARATGRTVDQVGGELRQFYIDHPGVSAAVVMSAGVGTGVLLQRAGVPATVAAAAQGALSQTGEGLKGVEEAIKAHPVLATAIGIGVAVGAGYAIHQAVN